MLGFVSGELIKVWPDMCLIEAGGIGYNILIASSLAEKLPPTGSSCRIYTYMSVREDAIKLYGFESLEELEFFKLLIGVGGIGPKGGQGILSVMSPEELKMAILSSDSKTIAKCPGIGAKTAQRIILDLKDKISIEEVIDVSENPENISAAGDLKALPKDAVSALTALGYSATEALKAVKQVEITPQMQVSDVLKAALKYL